jgi:hydroxyacylglutathione hydrolase
MFMRMIYDEWLAQGAYLIGCQRTGEAIVIDPERDVDRYIDLAAANDLRIVAAADTHIHADFLSGTRELAERVGARVYVSGKGGKDWRSKWLGDKAGGGAGGGSYDAVELEDGQTFRIGNIEFRAIHTPGHTPEHMSYVVTDLGSGASEPMGIATGDFVFVGDLGRPDLLETAAGQEGAKEPAARALAASARDFVKLPDYLQVWPAHGSGSACGKALGAVPQSTVGYEKRFNPALQFVDDEQSFVDFVLEGQPEPPLYFARMKRDNRDGVRILGRLPAPKPMNALDLGNVDGSTTAVLDTRPWEAFTMGHVTGALHAPLVPAFPTVAGSYVDENEPIVLIVEPADLDKAMRSLVRIGLDNIVGFATYAEHDAFAAAGANLATVENITAQDLAKQIDAGAVSVLDVRRAVEFAEGHIEGAANIAHTRLLARLDELPAEKADKSGKPIAVHCRSGERSSYAVAALHRLGYPAVNVLGGFLAWEEMGGAARSTPDRPVTSDRA